MISKKKYYKARKIVFQYENQSIPEIKESYFKRLKHHAGVGPAFIMSVAIFLAAASNKNIHSLWTVLIVGGIGSIIIWSIVLISNRK